MIRLILTTVGWKRTVLLYRLLVFSLCFPPSEALSQARAITVTVDVAKTGAALSEDHKTLTIAVLNPSDAQQSIHLDIHGATLASAGKLWRMAPNSIDATVKAGSAAEVHVEEQSLNALPATVTLRPYSVNIYSYPIQ